jgi:peptidoglycan/LPS O-acetylase OafA/YrhL
MISKPSAPQGYMRQLDGLRAIAVGIVLVHHLFNVDSLPIVLKHIPYGYLGVRLFFVLSGFLITGILLRERSAVESGKITIKYALRQFYTRRFLRIFPLYYFVIAVTLVIGLEETSEYWLSLITYTFNIELSLQGWYPTYLAHFWSLSVEEQYYIIWPWVILLVPRRRLIHVTLILIALAPVYRYCAYLSDFSSIAIYTFTFSSLDALGVGSLLAILSINRGGRLQPDRLLTWRYATLFLSLAVLLQVLFVTNTNIWPIYLVFFELLVAFIFAWLVWHASIGFSGIVGRLLESQAMVYIGKISYGIYVYHLFSPYPIRAIFELLDIDLRYKGLMEFSLSTLLTIMMASLSWHIMEAPINNLKRYFKYVPNNK